MGNALHGPDCTRDLEGLLDQPEIRTMIREVDKLVDVKGWDQHPRLFGVTVRVVPATGAIGLELGEVTSFEVATDAMSGDAFLSVNLFGAGLLTGDASKRPNLRGLRVLILASEQYAVAVDDRTPGVPIMDDPKRVETRVLHAIADDGSAGTLIHPRDQDKATWSPQPLIGPLSSAVENLLHLLYAIETPDPASRSILN